MLRAKRHRSLNQRALGSVKTRHVDRVAELLENRAVGGAEAAKGEKLDWERIEISTHSASCKRCCKAWSPRKRQTMALVSSK